MSIESIVVLKLGGSVLADSQDLVPGAAVTVAPAERPVLVAAAVTGAPPRPSAPPES